MHPILEKFRAAGLPAADNLRTALNAQLEFDDEKLVCEEPLSRAITLRRRAAVTFAIVGIDETGIDGTAQRREYRKRKERKT